MYIYVCEYIIHVSDIIIIRYVCTLRFTKASIRNAFISSMKKRFAELVL